MGLYINQEKHKDIYKNNVAPIAPNQDIFMHNHMAEMIKEQKKINHQLLGNISYLKRGYKQQEMKGVEISNQLRELKEGQMATNEVLPHLASKKDFYETIILQGEKHETRTEELKLKMEQQLELQKQIQEEIASQEEKHKEVIGRLDNHEALIQKVVRQVDFIRSLFYERTHYLAEKVEEGYRTTSGYMYSIMTNQNQLPLSLMLYQKHESKKKQGDGSTVS
ncbi:hypothetical protein [Oceanobacillus sp. CAU 1775]